MADEAPPSNPWMPLIWLVIFLVALVGAWIYAGGPERDDLNGFFIKGPIGTASSTQGFLPFSTPGYEDYAYTEQKHIEGYASGARNGAVSIDINGTQTSDPAGEYLTLQANPQNDGPVAISGWQIRSIPSGKNVTVPGAISLPLQGTPQSNGTVTLNPGDIAIISTGRSPVGMSFRENICTGYFGQFQQFSPSLSYACPGIQELQKTNLYQDESCVMAVQRTPTCEVITQFSDVSAECRNFVATRLTYNGCVAAHQTEQDFALPQWRLFLGQGQELWGNQNDIIVLLDQSGKLVASSSY